MDVSLPEQLLLLSYDDVSGKPFIPASHLEYGLAGAELLELTYAGRVGMEHGKLVPLDTRSADPVLVRMRAEKPHSADWWVYHLSSTGRRQQMLDHLVETGTLQRKQHRVLGIFGVKAYPETDPTQERALIDHLRDVVSGTAPPDQRSVGLIALAHACGLDKHLFPSGIKQRITELTRGEWCGNAVRKTIDAMNVAVLAAVSGGIVSSTAGAVAAT